MKYLFYKVDMSIMGGGNVEALRVTMEINIEEREGEEDRRKR